MNDIDREKSKVILLLKERRDLLLQRDFYVMTTLIFSVGFMVTILLFLEYLK